MPARSPSSRKRYADYRAESIRKRAEHAEAKPGEPRSPRPTYGRDGKERRPRVRSFTQLFAAFWGLMRGHRRTLVIALCCLGISTLLGLMPLYGTKIVFDSVLRDDPLPSGLPAWVKLPTDPRTPPVSALAS